MADFEVDVVYNERLHDTVFVPGAEDKDQAEYEAINSIRDRHDIGLSDVEIIEVREIA